MAFENATKEEDPILELGSVGGVLYVVLQAIFGVAILVSNCTVVVVIVKTRSLHSNTNALLASIAVADFFVGFHRIHSILYELELVYAPRLCQFAYACATFLCVSSVLHMYLITAERYVAISDPLRYRARLTRHRVAAAMGFSWTFSLTIACIPSMGMPPGLMRTYCHTSEVLSLEYLVAVFVVVFLVPGCGVVWVYWQIYAVVRRHCCQMKETAIILPPAEGDTGDTRRCLRKSFAKDLKAVRLLSLLLASFLLAWGPFFVEGFHAMLCGCGFNKVAYCTTVTLTFAKSLCNPFLYAFGRREVRLAILNSFPFTRRQHGLGEDDSSHVSTHDFIVSYRNRAPIHSDGGPLVHKV